MNREQSNHVMRRAQRLLVGGVNSPVRAFRGVGGEPVCIARGQGAHVWDVDGNRLLDFVCSYGPLILGHAHPAVIQAVTETAQRGLTFGATTELEVLLAEKLASAMPHLERVRFVSSGTEATMSALRLARGATGRDKVIKFAGCYHGHADAFLTDESGSGLATLDIPGSAGVTRGAASDTLTVPYNDSNAVEALFKRYAKDIACIIVEPIACNMGLVRPAKGFLEHLRSLCDAHGALLIFDEVITGLRVARGGAKELFGVTPDLTTLGKIIGGGMPVGAYGGRAELMEHVAPLGPVYQAGTLSGNPVSMAAGLATLGQLMDTSVYAQLEHLGGYMERKLRAVLERHHHPAYLSRVGSIFHLWFSSQREQGPQNYQDIKAARAEHYALMFNALLPQGVCLAPSAFEVGFLSAAHTEQDIDFAVAAMDHALERAEQGLS